jgi:hypothetical protein
MELEYGNIFREGGKFFLDLLVLEQEMAPLLGFGTILGVGFSP